MCTTMLETSDPSSTSPETNVCHYFHYRAEDPCNGTVKFDYLRVYRYFHYRRENDYFHYGSCTTTSLGDP